MSLRSTGILSHCFQAHNVLLCGLFVRVEWLFINLEATEYVHGHFADTQAPVSQEQNALLICTM